MGGCSASQKWRGRGHKGGEERDRRRWESRKKYLDKEK